MMFHQELRLCFRQQGDSSPKKRSMATTTPEVITKKLEELKIRWKKKIPAATVSQIDNLKKHARNGCLR